MVGWTYVGVFLFAIAYQACKEELCSLTNQQNRGDAEAKDAWGGKTREGRRVAALRWISTVLDFSFKSKSNWFKFESVFYTLTFSSLFSSLSLS